MDKLYVAFDGDSIGVRHGRALLADDPAEVRHVSSAIEAGEEVWRSWAIKNAGSVISAGGDEGLVEISPEILGEIPQVRQQYASAVGATCSVGVGRKMSEAAKALLVAKHRGKDRVCVYSDAMQPELDQIQNAKSTEDEKLNVYLAKDDGTGGAIADHGRGVSRPNHDHTVQQSEEPVLPPDGEPSGPSAQDFHALAGRQEQADRAQQAQQGVDIDALRQQTAQALMAVKAQLPVIQQVGASYPETAKAVLGLTQAVTNLARGVGDASATFQKSEPAVVWRDRELRVPSLNHPDRADFEDVVAKVEAAEFCMGDVSGFTKRECVLEDIDYPDLPDDLTRDALWYEVAKSGALPPVVLEKTSSGYAVLHGVRRIKAAVAARLNKVPALVIQREPDPAAKPPAGNELDKAADGLPHHQAHRRLSLPVGATAGGEIKVRHGTGKVGWRSVRSGMIMGTDASAPQRGQSSHPVSSRQPSSS